MASCSGDDPGQSGCGREWCLDRAWGPIDDSRSCTPCTYLVSGRGVRRGGGR